MTQSAYSDVERGRNSISYSMLLSLLEVYDLNPIWIMTGHGTQTMAKSHKYVPKHKPIQESVQETHEEYYRSGNISDKKSIEDLTSNTDIEDETIRDNKQDDLPANSEDTMTSTKDDTPMMSPTFENTQMLRIIDSLKVQNSALQEQVSALNELLNAYRMEAMKMEEKDPPFRQGNGSKKTG